MTSKVRRVSDARVTASSLNDEASFFTGAVYDAQGELVQESIRRVDHTDTFRCGDPSMLTFGDRVVGTYQLDGVDTFIQEAVYGGSVFGGWGHVILETCASAWAASFIPDDIPLMLRPWGRVWESSVRRSVELLRLAGWGERTVFVQAGSACIGELWVPEVPVDIEDLRFGSQVLDDRLLSVYDTIRKNCELPDGSSDPNASNIFLARTPGHRRAHPLESELEQAFRDIGFEVVQGWNMSVSDQVRTMMRSKCIVGFSGSNLHNSVFGDAAMVVVELLDQRALDMDATAAQFGLCASKGQAYLRVPSFRDEQPLSVSEIMNSFRKLVM